MRDFQGRPVETRDDVNRIIDEIKRRHSRIVSPSEVDPSEGWSPHFAANVFKGENLGIDDYRRFGNFENEEWHGDSNSLKLDDESLLNDALFYIEGTETTVKRLKLHGSFFNTSDPAEALEKYTALSVILLNRALPEDQRDADLIQNADQDFDVSVGATRVSRQTEEYQNGNGVSVRLILERGDDPEDSKEET